MHGLYLLWWVQEKHVSPAIVATILAAGDLALMLLEVPTGWFADRCGHRASLIVGSLVQVFGMLFCWLGQGIPGLVVASVLVALGDGFRSGADQALLYRTCVALGSENAFQPTEARTRAIVLVAMVVLVMIGGTIVQTWGFAAGWAVETAVCATGLVMACLMVEPPSRSVDTDVGAGRAAGLSRHVPANAPAAPPSRSRHRLLMVCVRFAAMILPAALLGAAASGSSFLALTSAIGPQQATRLVAMMTFAEAAGSGLVTRFPVGTVRSQALLAGVAATFVAAAAFHPELLLPTAVCLAFLLGVAHPARAAAIQSVAGETMRARAASMANACDMACKMIALPLVGRWRRRA